MPGESVLVAGLATGLASAIKAYIAAESRYRLPIDPAAPKDRDEISRALAEPPRVGVGYIYRTGVSLLILTIPVFAWFDALSLYLLVILISRVSTMPLTLFSAVLAARRAFR